MMDDLRPDQAVTLVDDSFRDGHLARADGKNSPCEREFLVFEGVRSPDAAILQREKDLLVNIPVADLRQPKRRRCFRQVKWNIRRANALVKLSDRAGQFIGIG